MKEKKLFIFIITVVLIFLIYSFYSLNRISRVFDLRIKISGMCYDYNESNIPNKKIKDAYLIYKSLPTYDEMVHSFKPLTLENYIDSTVLDELERPYIDNLENLK